MGEAVTCQDHMARAAVESAMRALSMSADVGSKEFLVQSRAQVSNVFEVHFHRGGNGSA